MVPAVGELVLVTRTFGHRLVSREFRQIGPDEAFGLLRQRVEQSGAERRRVDEYAESMRSGEWDPLGNSRSTGRPSPISILLGDGTTDGHWRLEAVLEVGLPQFFIVDTYKRVEV
jgi:hypothetical protein